MKNTAVFLLIGMSLHAADIELWNGNKAANAEILEIKEGEISFNYQGNPYKTELMKVKTIEFENESIIEKDVAFTSFQKGEYKKREGYLFGISVKTESPRIKEPFVRAFVLEEGKRGILQLKLCKNMRKDDPTLYFENPEIMAEDYRNALFFIPGNSIIALRLEVWKEGELVCSKNDAPDSLEAAWWQRRKIDRQPLLDRIVSEKLVDENITVDLPPVTANFTRISVVNDYSTGDVKLNLFYRLDSSIISRVPLPKVTLHYILEALDGRRIVQHLDCEENQDEEVPIVGGTVSRNLTHIFPSRIKLSKSEVNHRKRNHRQLIFWRAEISYDGHVIASQDAVSYKIKKDLPDQWWEKSGSL